MKKVRVKEYGIKWGSTIDGDWDGNHKNVDKYSSSIRLKNAKAVGGKIEKYRDVVICKLDLHHLLNPATTINVRDELDGVWIRPWHCPDWKRFYFEQKVLPVGSAS